MGHKKAGINQINGLDVIEEGYSLFKNTVFSALLFNLLGSIPFAIGLVYIIGDLSYGQASNTDITGSALVLTMLWMWNNLWQAVYRTRLVDYRCMRDETKLNLRTLTRIFIRQNILQPIGLIFSPLAFIPSMWFMTAFFNVFGVDYRDNPGIREQITRSKDIVGSDLKRIYLLMTVIWFFRVMLMVNFILILLFVPALLKMFFGIDTPFTHANSWLSSFRIVFNSTFFSAVFVTAWICYSPLEKAIWAIMIFYGESGKKGYDIIAGLSVLKQQRGMKIIIGLMVIFSISFGTVDVVAAESGSPVAEQAVSPAELRNEIKETLTKREYQWKLPVERSKNESSSVIGAFIRDVIDTIESTIKAGFKLLEKVFGGGDKASSNMRDFLGWLSAKRHIAIWGTVGLFLIIVGWFVLRWWRQRRKNPMIKVAETRVKTVDLTDEENVVADDLNENEWLELAARLMSEGQQKLAMRAMFLAAIKALADSHLLTIARGKTNRDYYRELRRRSHSEPGRIELFASSLGIFEKIWYGNYALINSDFDKFSDNIKKIMNLRKLC
jgi:hypothetical protein